MKKVLVVCVAVLLLGAGTAFAEGISVDVTGIYATEPVSGMGSTFGGGIGLNYDLSDIKENLQARADVSYLKWSESGVDLKSIPIFIGGRHILPLEPVNVFGEAGFETSIDSNGNSETNIGVALGGGVAYPINDAISAGLNARYHIQDNGYFSVGVFVAYNLEQ